LSSIGELGSVVFNDPNMLIGANVNFTQLANILEGAQVNDEEGFSYGAIAADYIRRRVANTNVRNVASIGGNLAMKNKHNGFASDIFNVLACLNAQIGLVDALNGERSVHSMLDFLQEDMNKKVILYVALPKFKANTKFRHTNTRVLFRI